MDKQQFICNICCILFSNKQNLKQHKNKNKCWKKPEAANKYDKNILIKLILPCSSKIKMPIKTTATIKQLKEKLYNENYISVLNNFDIIESGYKLSETVEINLINHNDDLQVVLCNSLNFSNSLSAIWFCVFD